MSAKAEDRRADQDQGDLIGDIIAEVARDHGVAISRDDPVVAVVLLNQVVLRRYLEETVAPAVTAIREATDAAVAHIEQLAEAQATWLEQVSLKDRASFLEEQKALHDAWKADMETLIEGQDTALQRVVAKIIGQIRTHTADTSAPLTVPPKAVHAPVMSSSFRSWVALAIGLLLGSSSMVAAFWVALR